MPRNERSLRITSAYRARLTGIRTAVERAARSEWRSLDPAELEASYAPWLDKVAQRLTLAQVDAVRASAGYLGAFLTSELDERTTPPALSADPYASLSRDGRPLAESLRSPLVGVLGAIKDGRDAPTALALGLDRAVRMVGMDFDGAARTALHHAMAADERFSGWQRAVRGTCGACLGAATGPQSFGEAMDIHPGCQCIQEPRVEGVRDRVPRPTGSQLFRAMAPDAQNELLGEEKAELVRNGTVTLAALVDHSHLATDQDDFITERPLEAL